MFTCLKAFNNIRRKAMAKTETRELKIPPEDKKKLDQIIAANKGKEGSLLTILEESQKINRHKFLLWRFIIYLILIIKN